MKKIESKYIIFSLYILTGVIFNYYAVMNPKEAYYVEILCAFVYITSAYIIVVAVFERILDKR